MDRTDAINVAFLAGVVVILVASFVYVNVFWEEPAEEEGESEEETGSFSDIPTETDPADPTVIAVAASPTFVSASSR